MFVIFIFFVFIFFRPQHTEIIAYGLALRAQSFALFGANEMIIFWHELSSNPLSSNPLSSNPMMTVCALTKKGILKNTAIITNLIKTGETKNQSISF